MEPEPGGLLTQTVSIGVATWDAQENSDELLQRTLHGLGAAKQKGGNRTARAPVSRSGSEPP
jgi:GGDEF domain-containing protein